LFKSFNDYVSSLVVSFIVKDHTEAIVRPLRGFGIFVVDIFDFGIFVVNTKFEFPKKKTF